MSARDWLRSSWDDRPRIVRGRYLRDLEVEYQMTQDELPEHRRYFPRIRTWLANLWYHRPVVTTFARLDERGEDGYRRALDETGEQAARIYEAGYAAGSGATAKPPTPPCPRHGVRTTSTGRSLVSV